MKQETHTRQNEEEQTMKQRIKQSVAGVLTVAVILSVGATSAFAADRGYGRNFVDTEDIFQTVFLKYVLSSLSFESKEHEKAWFIRVTINACKDLLKR